MVVLYAIDSVKADLPILADKVKAYGHRLEGFDAFLSWDKSHSSKQSSPPSLEVLIRSSVPLGGPIWPKNLGSLGMYSIEVVKMVTMAKVNWKMEMETHSLWARIYCGKLKNTYPLEFPIFMENIIFIKLLWECW